MALPDLLDARHIPGPARRLTLSEPAGSCGRRFPGFPYDPESLLASKRPPAEVWAVLVARGHVAREIFSGKWFVIRAGVGTAANAALSPAA